ncbi:uncharacterized protein K460DRAFT_277727 [Cucurbitaria berberidis CBS 394.84]|uniref:Uncharacterized protein n=1 Tax=Cucurbitaria berberidis CBS 394.84 TaxID=1168544 RepID=A0A9P4L9M7_9PLEO|nr:uncharacterized protein K460DRAFT_277727 [Cucurbitaria berberidis CBS 394.84]KAF1847190.1 hypothetical protein K460DRAFT_277727 [Cucurbitaria berberidis CBS 394.84]
MQGGLQSKFGNRLKRKRAEIEFCIRSHAQTSKRVHAEIQLLFYYEASSATSLRPRIICSNKHACFLCNLFIRAHGKFHIRSCHGRLYPSWRIPLLKEVQLSEQSEIWMQQSLDRLNHLLEEKIREYLDRPRLRISDPTESVIFIPGTCSPSAVSIVSSLNPIREDANTTATDLGQKDIVFTRPAKLQYLDHGQLISIHLYPRLPIRIHTRCIHLELTYELACVIASSSSSTISSGYEPHSSDTGLLVQVECIDGGDPQVFPGPGPVFDLSSPWCSKEVPDSILFGELGLVLKKRNDVISVRVLQ